MKRSLEMFHLSLFVLVIEQANLKVNFKVDCDSISVRQCVSFETEVLRDRYVANLTAAALAIGTQNSFILSVVHRTAWGS